MKHRIFFLMCAGFLSGIAFRSWHEFLWWQLVLGVALALVAALRVPRAAVVIISFIVGAWWFSVFTVLRAGNLALFEKSSDTVVRGVIRSTENPSASTQEIQLEVKSVVRLGTTRNMHGAVYIRTTAFPQFTKNTDIEALGMLEPLPENATTIRTGVEEEMRYPKIRVIRALPDNGIERMVNGLRTWITATTHRLFPEPEASFFLGLVIGDKTGLPISLKNAFTATGTAHLIAVSGFNVTIIFTAMTALLGTWSSRRVTFVLSVLFLGIFVGVCGFSASVVRAACMGVVAHYAKNNGRMVLPENALLGTATAMCIGNPTVLLYDIGFQLSFAATIGIVWCGKYFESKLSRIPKEGGIQELVATTLSAQLLTLPLIVFVFGRISLITLPINVIALPLIPILMGVGMVAVVLSTALPWLHLVFAFVPFVLLRLELNIIEITARLPFASVTVPQQWNGILLVYIAAIVPVFFIAKKYQKKLCVYE